MSADTPVISAKPVRRNLHVLIACLLIAATAAGGLRMSWKLPVPWPEGCKVSDDFRLTSLPERFGPDGGRWRYEMIAKDGVLFWDNKTRAFIRDGKPDGEMTMDSEVRVVLGVGTYEDAPRLPERASNWYVSRLYDDLRQPPRSALSQWQLDMTYYTGKMDNVAHVPGRCMLAAGAKPAGPEETLEWKVPGAGAEWNTVRVMRSRFIHPKSPGEYVQYYTFSLNGVNEPSWKRVYMGVTRWGKEYSYFAKIQFAPRHTVTDVAACDRAAQSFFSAFLPEVLPALPTKADVEKLNADKQQKKETGKNG